MGQRAKTVPVIQHVRIVIVIAMSLQLGVVVIQLVETAPVML